MLSSVAVLRHGVTVEHLGRGARHHAAAYSPALHLLRSDPNEELLAENHVTPVSEQVAFRIDWPAFVGTLPERDQAMMSFLGIGNSNQAAAAAFQISPGRVSQLRRG